MKKNQKEKSTADQGRRHTVINLHMFSVLLFIGCILLFLILKILFF